MGARGKLPTTKLPVAGPAVTDKTDEAQRRRWRAEDALRTITQAENYKRDSGLMKDVKALANEQINDLKRVK